MNINIESTLRTTSRLALLVVICSLFTHCRNTKSSDLTEIEELIRNADKSLQQAVYAKDLDLIISFYADDAVLLPTAEPMVRGKESIKEEWRHILEIPNFENKSTLSKVEISKDGEMAYTMGTYLATMMGEDENLVQEPGKWVSIWKSSSDGVWRIIVDMYNTDIPPPDHK